MSDKSQAAELHTCRTCGRLKNQGGFECPVGLSMTRATSVFEAQFNPDCDCDKWKVK